MMFCPKCGSLLRSKNEDGKIISFCSCGYEKKSKEEIILKEEIKNSENEFVTQEINPLATENHKCSKCGCEKAILIGSQIGVRETCRVCETDRPAFVCGRCGFKEFI